MKKKNSRKKDRFDLGNITTPIDEHFYRLEGHQPIRCTLAEYAQAMADELKRIVLRTNVDGIHISTVFTGIDRNFGKGPRLLFETVVFGLPDDLHPQWLHSTWDEATGHHMRLADAIREGGAVQLLEDIRKKTGQTTGSQG